MKSLKIIQILAKILRVIFIVVFIACIVGASFCLLGLILLPIFQGTVIYEGKTFEVWLMDRDIPLYEAYLAVSTGLLSCGVGIFLGKYNELFFKEEIELGTPFSKDIVRKMRMVALINIIASFALGIVVGIGVGIVKAVNHSDFEFKYELLSFVGFGLALLVISLFCDYGAEAIEPKVEESQEPEEN